MQSFLSSYSSPPRAGCTLLVAASNALEATQERADFVCTGTNDQLTIQAAIYALPTDGDSRRGTILLSEGDFSLAGTILVPGHTQIIGSGWGTKLLATSGMNSYLLQFQPVQAPGNTLLGAEGIRIAHLFLDQNASAQTAGGLIDGWGARLCTIERCYFTRAYDASLWLHTSTGGNVSQQNRVIDCFFDDGHGDQIRMDGRGNMIMGNTFAHIGFSAISGTARAISCLSNALHNIILGNSFSNDTGVPGCFIEESTSGSVGSNIIESNCFEIVGGTSFPVIKPNTFLPSIIRGNIGYLTENKGTATISNGNTTGVVSHGLSLTPNPQDIKVTALNNAGSVWITNVTATSFTINCSSTAPSGGFIFGWQVQIL